MFTGFMPTRRQARESGAQGIDATMLSEVADESRAGCAGALGVLLPDAWGRPAGLGSGTARAVTWATRSAHGMRGPERVHVRANTAGLGM